MRVPPVRRAPARSPYMSPRTVCSTKGRTNQTRKVHCQKLQGPPPGSPVGAPPKCWRSDGAHVLGLGTLGALGDLELDALVLLEGLVALHLDRGEVHEDVVAAALLRNEAEALLGVEPLDGALC